MVRIADLDAHDDVELRAFWEVEQAAQRADRSHPVLWTWERRLQMLPQPGAAGRRRTLLTAYVEGQLVGVAEPSGSTRDDLHLAELEVNVLPSHRRRGIGRALHDEAVLRGRTDGRRTIIGEVTQPSAGEESACTEPDNEPMQRLNRGLGFRRVELMHEMQRRDADG
jgi:GNAT superfamily N-acetyltransferase